MSLIVRPESEMNQRLSTSSLSNLELVVSATANLVTGDQLLFVDGLEQPTTATGVSYSETQFTNEAPGRATVGCDDRITSLPLRVDGVIDEVRVTQGERSREFLRAEAHYANPVVGS